MLINFKKIIKTLLGFSKTIFDYINFLYNDKKLLKNYLNLLTSDVKLTLTDYQVVVKIN